MHGGDLATALYADRGSPRKLGWYSNGAPVALGIARGLTYLDRQAKVWGAAAPSNVLLDQTGSSAKIAGLEFMALGDSAHELWRVRHCNLTSFPLLHIKTSQRSSQHCKPSSWPCMGHGSIDSQSETLGGFSESCLMMSAYAAEIFWLSSARADRPHRGRVRASIQM